MSLLDAFEPVAPRTLPVVLLLDTSGSMKEDDKIDVLNDSVTEMIEELTEVDAGNAHRALRRFEHDVGESAANIDGEARLILHGRGPCS